MKKKYFSVIFLTLVFLACQITTDRSVQLVRNIFHSDGIVEEKKPVTVVIDPGHGGRDPGKVGINNALEKDVNLSIAFKLKNLLELNDINVIMTRESDIGLYSDYDSNKKNADLNKRVDIIHTNEAELAVSIHQNSFGEAYVRGAQTFYHGESPEGKHLAEFVLEQIKDAIGDDNHRKAKANRDYYMLRKTKCPFVIVECGYMSNPNEAALLIDEEYQEKLAWGIHMGIMRYINKSQVNSSDITVE